MFRASTCPSSGGQILLSQHLVSLLSVNRKDGEVQWAGNVAGLGDNELLKRQTCFNYQLSAQFLYSITIYMLHYIPRHVSSSTMLIFRRSNCIITATGIVILCKRLYSMPVESGVTIPDAVIIQFDLLKMSILMLETCRGL